MNDIDDINGKTLGGPIKIWADAHAFSAQVKGSNILIRPKMFIITSQYLPKQIWKGNTKTLEAINRRFHVVHFAEKSWEDPDNRISPAFDAPRVQSIEEPNAPATIHSFYHSD